MRGAPTEVAPDAAAPDDASAADDSGDTSTTGETGDSAVELATVDADGDGVMDVAWAGAASGTLMLAMGPAVGRDPVSDTWVAPDPRYRLLSVHRVGDQDGDGLAELVAVYDDQLRVWSLRAR